MLLYCPASHAVHAVASAAANVFVTHPDAHTAHATVGCALYCPAPHAVQLLPPTWSSVSVADPDPHTSHCV
jgi:hypothetical protein